MKIRHFLSGLALVIASFGALAEPVNINEADPAVLAEALVGVGPAKAKAIVEFRQKHGSFKSKEEIKLVEGIGDAIYEQNKDNIKIED